MSAPDLILYTDSSPNGFKITIALEEMGLPYNLRHVRIDEGEHQRPEFLALNPHGRIPVLIDRATGITLFESAAILLYLADKSGQLLGHDAPERWLRHPRSAPGKPAVAGRRHLFDCRHRHLRLAAYRAAGGLRLQPAALVEPMVRAGRAAPCGTTRHPPARPCHRPMTPNTKEQA